MAASPETSEGPRPRLVAWVAVVGAVVLVAGMSVGVWAIGGAQGGPRAAGCAVPSLAGSVVRVTLSDMGGMMGGGMMGSTMRIIDRPAVVPAGQVSFRVANVGSLTHELVVLPLPPGGAGSRPVGSDGRVSEAGSLGEASKTCGAGAGEGIAPGAAGWVTLRLPRGRYELICNIPSHYASGMYAELDVD